MLGEFTFIVGPMASGKSSTLVTELSKYSIANKRVVALQPKANVRDAGLSSRNGLNYEALHLDKLSKLTELKSLDDIDVIGVDEVFMFAAEDAREAIMSWLAQGKVVVVAAIDISAMGRMPETVQALMELAPNMVYERAVCEGCDELDARYTQIIDKSTDTPIRSGLPDLVPDDGTYAYRPVCRDCFFGWSAATE